MQRAIERRLAHLEELIPLPLNYSRFVSRVGEHARRDGLSPGSALVALRLVGRTPHPRSTSLLFKFSMTGIYHRLRELEKARLLARGVVDRKDQELALDRARSRFKLFVRMARRCPGTE
jgi:hypothetical protein